MVMPKKSIINWERNMPMYKHIKWNHPIMSHTPYKRKYDHLRKMIMTQYPSSFERGMPLCKHIKWNLSSMSHISKWNERLITSREWLWIKIHHCLREICSCVKLTKSNYLTTSHTPMWKKHLITSRMAMTQNPSFSKEAISQYM